MASIVQRNKNFSVVYTIYDGGKKNQKWETYRSYEVALRRKEQLNLLQQHEKERARYQEGTLAQFLKEYVELYGRMHWACSTYTSNEGLIRTHIILFMGSMRLTEFPPKKVTAALYGKLQLDPKISPSVMTNIHKLLHSAFEQAVLWKYVTRNPFQKANVPKSFSSEIPMLSVDEIKTLLQNCDNQMNPRCQKLSELDAKTAEMDKEWYAKRDPKTEEPTKIAKIYVTVYYAEKGEQMLHHFKKSIDIGNGHGGIVSQLKYDNEMKLTDEYWINYQKGKGSEEFQKYMEDLTDMQNHVLPYLQSFFNLEEKGVKERREQQIAERYEGRADERVTSTEANEVVKDVGKTDRKPAQQKQAVDGKDKKLSIHERLEINKRIIQEKQGKDKTERGVDLGVRTV